MVEVFREGQLETLCAERIGPCNESSFQFVTRMFSTMSSYVTNPPRFEYALSDLTISTTTNHMNTASVKHSICPFTVKSYDNVNIVCTMWEILESSDTIILYIHTNTRSLVDAKEVIPLAEQLQANVVGFDLPGSGKSNGSLNAKSYMHITSVIEECQKQMNCKNIILWARGCGTFLAMQYCALIVNQQISNKRIIRFVVLDTPFTSFKSVVNDIIQQYEQRGNYFPHSIFSIVNKLVRISVRRSAGIDLYDIKPIELAKVITVPALVLAGLSDDYVNTNHGQLIHAVFLCALFFSFWINYFISSHCVCV